MRVYPDKLQQYLTKVSPCYLLFGDDPWLIHTSKIQILAAARQQGFEERIQLIQDSQFQWRDLITEWQSMSLFSSKRIIELTLPQAKPAAEGSRTLQEIIETPNADNLLIIEGPKLGLDQQKSKWFKTLDKEGVFIPCATPEGSQFQHWLDKRIQFYQLNLKHDAKAILFKLYEGNLLAADQAMQLLQLLVGTKAVDGETLHHYFDDQSRFNVFQLTDALLSNEQAKVQHILLQLQAESTPMPVIHWAIQKELSLLLTLQLARHYGENLSNLFSKHRIWDKRKPLYSAALNRLSLAAIESMLAVASKLELQLKTQGAENWTGLSHLCLLFEPKAQQNLSHIEFE